jgi:hypothetical protein
MGQKVGQAIGSEGFVRVGCLSHLLGSIFSLAPRSTAYRCLIFPPTPNSDFSLFSSNVISPVLGHSGFREAIQDSCQDLCTYFLSISLAAASYVPGISFPAGEEPKISGACTVSHGMTPSAPLGVRQTMRFMKKRGPTCSLPGSMMASMFCNATGEWFVGKGALDG